MAYRSQSITKGIWGRNSRQEPENRNWSRGRRGALHTGFFSVTDSDAFLIPFRSIGLRLTLPSGLGSPTLITNYENVPQRCSNWLLIEAILLLSFLPWLTKLASIPGSKTVIVHHQLSSMKGNCHAGCYETLTWPLTYHIEHGLSVLDIESTSEKIQKCASHML